MKNFNLPSAVFGALAVIGLLSLTSLAQPPQDAEPTQDAERQEWEYEIVEWGSVMRDNKFLREMTFDTMGNSGWSYHGVLQEVGGSSTTLNHLWVRPKN